MFLSTAKWRWRRFWSETETKELNSFMSGVLFHVSSLCASRIHEDNEMRDDDWSLMRTPDFGTFINIIKGWVLSLEILLACLTVSRRQQSCDICCLQFRRIKGCFYERGTSWHKEVVMTILKSCFESQKHHDALLKFSHQTFPFPVTSSNHFDCGSPINGIRVMRRHQIFLFGVSRCN